MKVQFNLPEFLPMKKVNWNNNNITYIVGINGVGKTILMQQMMRWCESKNYTHNFYDSMEHYPESKIVDNMIDNSSNEDMIYTCKILCEFSYEFSQDVERWEKHFKSKGHLQDAEILRKVIHMCGSGYTRMWTMVYLGIQQVGADYYFMDMPETSVHISIVNNLLEEIMRKFQFTKIVITTHSPDVIGNRWNKDNIIEMSHNFIEDTTNFKFDEIFG